MNIVVLDGFTMNPGDLSWDNLEKLGSLKVYERTSADQLMKERLLINCWSVQQMRMPF